MKEDILNKSLERLEELAGLEGSELGEAWDKLIYLNSYQYCFSDEFNEAVKKEIIEQAKEAEEDFEIVEEEIPRESFKRKMLRRR